MKYDRKECLQVMSVSLIIILKIDIAYHQVRNYSIFQCPFIFIDLDDLVSLKKK